VWGIEDVEADHQQRGHIGVWTMEVVDGKQEVLKSLSQPLQRKEKGKRKKLEPRRPSFHGIPITSGVA
jgi:hypothetical protein